MKKIKKSAIALIPLALLVIACTTRNGVQEPEKGAPSKTGTQEPANEYQQTAALDASASLTGKAYEDINTYMKTYGFDYSEHANCNGGYGGHPDGVHCTVELDPYFNKQVFRFTIHIDPVIDGDRCNESTVDRQRNEMKSATNNTTWAKVQGNWDEWQVLEWKFRLPKGFQPTSSFCHIHQLKAQDGPNNGSPLITITPRASSNGGNKRIQIIHTVDGASTGKGTIVDNIPLADFEDEWVQVREEMHYTHTGYYACKITRVRDGKVLLDFKDENIDMWRTGSSYIRNKYGIYRSLAGGQLDHTPVGQSPLLKNESLWLTDFKVYEKHPNPNPGQAHD
ncbi:polysaccharide lyase [Niabella pedocola]|uniref:Polysaccharide lyase n=1 Tax=Niabella pedocola TaxID=1752077 RepID=A0ABS8PXI0_9BACT|nr:polysaccharide lyase [Niabella pedocola]MCD2425771.1 polysaccharide lyase [Niabella pedocola]